MRNLGIFYGYADGDGGFTVVAAPDSMSVEEVAREWIAAGSPENGEPITWAHAECADTLIDCANEIEGKPAFRFTARKATL